MSTADDRHDEDVWAQAVAEDAKEQQEQAKGSATESEKGPDEGAGKGSAKDGPASSSSDLFGPELAPLVDEVRKFASAVGGKVSEASSALNGGDGMQGLQQLAAPLRSKHPEVYGHLIAAGGELLAAYRAAVAASERRWTQEKSSGSEHIDLD
jgi:hypothetical protein